MRKRFFMTFGLVLGLFFVGFAQKSDPKAKTILEKVKKTYNGYKSFESDFTLTIEPAEQSREVQEGKMAQEGSKFYFKLENQEIISDGKTTWVYLKNNNEVQINNAETDSEDAIMTPKDVLQLYKKGKFEYFLNGETSENSKNCHLIEIKPLDKDTDYSKLKLSIDKKTNQVVAIRTFNKDGSRYTMLSNKIVTNKPVNDNLFIFDKSKYPDVHIEDLR